MNSEDLKQKITDELIKEKIYKIKSHGRLEILGNHTDHNHGLCLVGAASLAIYGAFKARDDKQIHIESEGFETITLCSSNIQLSSKEYGTTRSLVKGIIKGFTNHKYNVGGFTLKCYSTIFPGAGVSSSAAFEALICSILNFLYNRDAIPEIELAKISQYAEKEFFGKPCGLLDQIGALYGGVSFVDFKDVDNPIVEPVNFNLPLDVVLVNTNGSHEGLTNYYASIPEDMKEVAKHFGKSSLRDVKESEFDALVNSEQDLPFSEIAKSRASHFFDENRRVKAAFNAIKEKDVETFLRCVKYSQNSSQNNLKNTQIDDKYQGSPQEAVDRANSLIKNGACRIMGGGFAGSIICFINPKETKKFIKKMSSYYGEKSVVKVTIPDQGTLIAD